jgi:hypothetical protein
MKFYALFVHAGNTKLVGQCKKKMMYKLINIEETRVAGEKH